MTALSSSAFREKGGKLRKIEGIGNATLFEIANVKANRNFPGLLR